MIRLDPDFERDLERLDRPIQLRVINYLRERIAKLDDPATSGKPLGYGFAGYWRYRVGDYRIICRLERTALLVVAVSVAHRSTIYDR